jgi:hypothetical protein
MVFSDAYRLTGTADGGWQSQPEDEDVSSMEWLKRVRGLPKTESCCQSLNKMPISATLCDPSVVKDARDRNNERCT